MPAPTKTILFTAANSTQAQEAAKAFSSASSRLGLSWGVTAHEYTRDFNPGLLKGFAVVVPIDLPDFAVVEGSTRLERITAAPNIEQAINGLIARLLGGSEIAPSQKPPTPPPPKKVHTAKVSRETAGRKGKGVTVISDLPLSEEQLKELATLLKNKCGTGGTAKDGRIEIQGDQRDRICQELEKLGYKVKRAGG
jgi:predicted translation initiation factor SUI1